MNIRCFFYAYAVFRLWKPFYEKIPQDFFDDKSTNSRVETPVKHSHRLDLPHMVLNAIYRVIHISTHRRNLTLDASEFESLYSVNGMSHFFEN